MAFFDSGNSTRMDSSTYFDEKPPTNLTGKRMPSITLDLQAKSDSQLALDAKAVFEATNSKAKYAPAQTTITLLGVAVTDYETKLSNQILTATDALAATSAKTTSRTSVESALTALVGAFGTIIPPLTAADILEANLSIRAAAVPIGNMPAVIDFLATMGDDVGEVDLTWSRVKGTRVYDVEYRLHVDGSTWTRLEDSPTKSKTTVSGLISGTAYAFRVRAVGAAGAGPWSDESVKMAS